MNEAISRKYEDHYIWHTVGDDKVRDSHAALEGEVRSWEEFPNPMEEYGCRCWAKPVADEVST